MKSTTGYKRKKSWLFGLLGLCLLFILFAPLIDFLERLELQTFDARQATLQEERSQSRIAIVEIDDTSIAHPGIQKIFGRFPYRRDIYGYFLRFMNRAQPQRVIIDQSFSLGGDLAHPEADLFLAQSVSQTYPVISGLNTFKVRDLFNNPISDSENAKLINRLQEQWVKIITEPNDVRIAFAPIAGLQPPLAELLKTQMLFYPYSNLLYDANGKARRAVLFSMYLNALIMPTLPMSATIPPKTQQVEWSGSQLTIASRTINLRGEGAPIIRWYGNIKEQKGKPVYTRFSFWHIIQSQLQFECQQTGRPTFCQQLDFNKFKPIDPNLFQQHFVFLGTTTNTYDQDNHPSLYDEVNKSKYPGVYIQANIMDNILHDDFVSRAGWRIPCPLIPWSDTVSLVTILTVLGLMATTAYCCLRWSSIPLSIIGVAALGIGYAVFTVIAYQQWNVWLNMVYPITGILTTLTGAYIYRYYTTEKRKEQLRSAFGRYISPAVVETIIQRPEGVQTACHRRRLTILFCDIRGFTTLSETQDPAYVQSTLSEYFAMMNNIIINQYQGVIDKLIGDAIMAYWGFPLEIDNHEEQAVACAIAMQKAIEQWQKDPTKPAIDIGIGIHTGEVMVGDVGSEDFMDFTVIGDTVNTASRLEGGNKQFGTRILISEATRQALPEARFNSRDLGQIDLKGKSEAVHVFEPSLKE